ncbi:MAG: hypothetical protein DSZ03_08730 [Sulfurimonas sp.]|nr:MAG: hypothetical protein DSZ03_08730 [Sulfurimonas sp.]
MKKKICLRINSTPFNIDVEEEFAAYLNRAMQDDFNVEGNNDVKIVLQAYVRKNYQLYENEKRMKQIHQAISKTID